MLTHKGINTFQVMPKSFFLLSSKLILTCTMTLYQPEFMLEIKSQNLQFDILHLDCASHSAGAKAGGVLPKLRRSIWLAK